MAMRSDSSAWENGDTIDLGNGVEDVVHEFGCRYTAEDGTIAQAWVFAPPVDAAGAQRLVKAAGKATGCEAGSGPAFGAPTLALTCTTKAAWCGRRTAGCSERRVAGLRGRARRPRWTSLTRGPLVRRRTPGRFGRFSEETGNPGAAVRHSVLMIRSTRLSLRRPRRFLAHRPGAGAVATAGADLPRPRARDGGDRAARRRPRRRGRRSTARAPPSCAGCAEGQDHRLARSGRADVLRRADRGRCP